MLNTLDSTDITTRRMRQVARILSIIIIVFTLVMAVAHIVFPEPDAADYSPLENLLPVLMIMSVLGLGVAWRWEGAGGAINLGFFLANIVLYLVIRGKFFPLRGLLVLSVAIIPGVLFLIYWWRTRNPKLEMPSP